MLQQRVYNRFSITGFLHNLQSNLILVLRRASCVWQKPFDHASEVVHLSNSTSKHSINLSKTVPVCRWFKVKLETWYLYFIASVCTQVTNWLLQIIMRELWPKSRMRNRSLYRIPVQGLLFLHKSTSTDTFIYDSSDPISNIFCSTSLHPKGFAPFISREGILTS